MRRSSIRMKTHWLLDLGLEAPAPRDGVARDGRSPQRQFAQRLLPLPVRHRRRVRFLALLQPALAWGRRGPATPMLRHDRAKKTQAKTLGG